MQIGKVLHAVCCRADIEDLKSGARKWCLVFVGIGCGALCFGMLQSYSFNFMGQKLAHRVRIMMMRALLRQVGSVIGMKGQ